MSEKSSTECVGFVLEIMKINLNIFTFLFFFLSK